MTKQYKKIIISRGESRKKLGSFLRTATKFQAPLIILFLALFLVGGFLGYIPFVHAQANTPNLGLQPVGANIGLPSTDIRVVVANIIRTALGLLGIVALVLILYGGFVWMTAGGDEEKISTAKKILFNSAIGLAIILSSYAIASFVISRLVGATTDNTGLGGPGGGGGGGDNPYFPAGIFYVDSLPAGGQMCIRNVHPAITFNKEVDVATLNGNVVVQKSDGTEQAGAWQLLSNTTAAFVPNGDCGSGTPDCFAAATAYTLHFKNGSAVKTSDGLMSLNCVVKAGCADVSFTTGDGVDRNPPQVKIEPIAGDLLRVGTTVPVQVSYTDDNGVQKIDLNTDNYFVGSQTVSGCQKTGSVTINWPTVGIAGGPHLLGATGYDWSALSNNTSTNVNLLPQHCFDNILQADLGEITVGPPASGGECGAGAGSPCAGNIQCASGYCDSVASVCVDKMRINGISPLSGGPGTLVSVSGNYFGDNPGRVFFSVEANKANLSRTSNVGWVQADLGCGVNSWKNYQILAEVPSGAVSGPIQVIKDLPTNLWRTNGDFESNTEGFMVYPPGLFSRNGSAYQGANSLEIKSGGAHNAGGTYGGASAVMPALTLGKLYTFSFWAKNSANAGQVTVSVQSGAGDQNCLSFSFAPTSQWQQYSKTCRLDLIKDQVFFWSSNANGSFLVDNIKVTGSEIDFTDHFNNPNTLESNWGPEISDFTVNNQVRPGLCGIVPASDLSGAEVSLIGQRFGIAVDKVFFGQQSVPVTPVNWTDTLIKTRVPLLEAGPVGVKITKNNVDSNSVRFFVEQGLSGTTPFISSITPDHGGKGDYITITGNNFGDQTGRVAFKENNNGQPGDAIEGDFTFPPGCQNTWTDKQIVVKFPAGSGTVGKSYFVQVRPANIAQGFSPLGPVFDLQAGLPAPGICSINPVSGPVPFAAAVPDMKIIGENFGLAPEVYFWGAAASPASVSGRVLANTTGVANLSTGQVISTRPLAGTISGSVVVLRKPDNKLSNPQNFSVVDCVKNNNTCTAAGTHCCAVGTEAGMCKPNTELCSGETLAAGFIWRFSTKDIPKIPRVVERCDNNTDAGLNIPTPSPSVSWDTSASGAHHNVCRTASVVVEFNLPTINNISRNNFLINECTDGTVNETQKTCTVAQTVDIGGPAGDLVPQLSTENTSYLQLNPNNTYNNGKWKDNTWYQVILGSGITAGSGTSSAHLAKDMPCGADSAYCFVFKSDAQDCRMKQVVVTPYSYRTSVLEAPIKHRDFPADAGEDVVYSGHGLSTQHCVVMDTAAFNWSWNTQNIYYANIFSTDNSSAKVSSLANTVGVGLTNPDNGVNINAVASLASANYAGHSPLTIDLNNPEVVDFWPTCLQSCTNAEVGVRFNTTMSNKNLPSGPVKLLKCNDENCFNTAPVQVAADIILDSASDYRVLKITNSGAGATELEPNTIYQVVLSASSSNANSSELLWSAAKLGDPTTYSKPYSKQFTWRFKTKTDKCKISRVDVVPQNYFAEFINDKEIYSAQPYSSPDTCSSAGQKLNSWTVDWNWNSSLPAVASVQTFSTKGNNPYCALSCVRKGSSIALGSVAAPVCGNGVVEAGEDCDSPNKGAGCGLDCRRLGNTNTSTCGNGIIEPGLGETCDPGLATSAVGCGSNCLRSGSALSTGATATGASICGNGAIGSGEDCDLGITPSVAAANSSMLCANNCLHQGTKLSNNWCFANSVGRGGFSQADFNSACRAAISRCGDGIDSPDEDTGCDLGNNTKASWCNDFCLVNSNNAPTAECVANTEGCDQNGRHIGSSLLYSTPSLCGDGVAGIGEDGFCETNLPHVHTGINPWSLVTGVGMGAPSGIPPTQQTDINVNTTEGTGGGPVGNKGKFTIACGYKTDEQCQARLGINWGVAANGCCYLRPSLQKVYPGNTSTAQANVCPNTAIEATFNQEIDVGSLKNNIIVARGLSLASSTNGCGNNEDVTNLAVISSNDNNLPWYKKIFVAVVNFFKNLVGQDAAAVRTDIQSVKWCAGQDTGSADVITISSTSAKIIFKLNQPLAFDTDYFVALKDGLRSKQGISIGKNINGKPFGWKFITGSTICEISGGTVDPAQTYLDKLGATATLVASAYNINAAQIQPIPGYYAWNYLWQPENPYVNLQTTTSSVNVISAQNHSGEIDVRAKAIITDNVYSTQRGSVALGKSHAIVFLCENPWPPKDLYLSGAGPYVIFPYEDKVGNNDGFSLSTDAFDNTAIPPSPSGGYFNFRSYYCADNGSFGVADDLPYLRPAVQVSSAIVSDSPTSSLKRFIFTSAKNNDAIGIAVFSNLNHLTVADWFARDRSLGGQGFTGNMQTTKIDGYDALTDGNNIYVDALNYSNSSNNLYSNIYLFSINANAQPETRKVFEQMIANLHFNTNLTNYGYCGPTMANPGASTTCQTDLDCAGGEVCSVQIDKLKRNYQRLRDLNEIQNLFGP